MIHIIRYFYAKVKMPIYAINWRQIYLNTVVLNIIMETREERLKPHLTNLLACALVKFILVCEMDLIGDIINRINKEIYSLMYMNMHNNFVKYETSRFVRKLDIHTNILILTNKRPNKNGRRGINPPIILLSKMGNKIRMNDNNAGAKYIDDVKLWNIMTDCAMNYEYTNVTRNTFDITMHY